MCIGGFISEKWSLNDDYCVVKDNTAKLFNFSSHKVLKVKMTHKRFSSGKTVAQNWEKER